MLIYLLLFVQLQTSQTCFKNFIISTTKISLRFYMIRVKYRFFLQFASDNSFKKKGMKYICFKKAVLYQKLYYPKNIFIFLKLSFLTKLKCISLISHLLKKQLCEIMLLYFACEISNVTVCQSSVHIHF